ncbi:PH domain-containing protein [Corynebacterium sp. ES2794-CONJ1]|uniref:PH domain-containing protein n=1 Tax=unclassified Corynebacterium TaxID=2624378 RepID=UPI00216AEBD6|nr:MULTISPECIES: PH domain-containing protein [unclassified Corynebacterium]MCS4531453.1 PH domain-containing protein [Corynebacterium sp. ES2730-CONJ]MCU9518841.1 PH domain-containing protein [Corynebacterium sp. ES2794-CONJ1]
MSDIDKHRLHPLTPVAKSGDVIVATTVFAITAGGSSLGELVDMVRNNWDTAYLRAVLLPLVALMVFLVIVGSLLYVGWRAISYEIHGTEVVYRSGIIRKKVRSARFDKIQAIELFEPINARIFGLAAVRLEQAGGTNSHVDIAYLKRADALALKDQLLGQTRRHTAAPTREKLDRAEDKPSPHNSPQDTATLSPEIIVPPIPVWMSLTAAALSKSTLISLLITIPLFIFQPLPTIAIFSFLLPLVVNAFQIIDRSYRFTVERDGETLNISYGLLNLERKTLHAERTHAVDMVQPVTWRLLDWWLVRVSVAGYGNAERGMLVLPIGNKEKAMKVVAALMGNTINPDLKEQSPADDLDNIRPQTSRPWEIYRSPQRARFVSPIDWNRQYVLLNEDFIISTRGRIGRSVAMAHRRHIQHLELSHGPFERLAGIESVTMAIIPGPVTIKARQLGLQDARGLIAEVAELDLNHYLSVSNR